MTPRQFQPPRTIALELTCPLAAAPFPLPHARTGKRLWPLLAAFPTPEFLTPTGLFHGSAPWAQPIGKLSRCSAPSAGSARRRSLQTRLASEDGGVCGDCGRALEAACGRVRRTVASASRRGAAAGLAAARVGNWGCGAEEACGSLHFPARPGAPGVR